MILTTRDLEPFNTAQVDNTEAAMFMRRLTGQESFKFSGTKRPKAVMVYDLKFAYPRHCYAHGFLLSVGVDEFMRLCEASAAPTMELLMKRHVIGKIHIEYGGTLQSVSIKTEALDLSKTSFDYSHRSR